ncbi:MAG: PhoH family protein [Bacteroidales bacterium]|jgi:PhoH-like ATPase|nr:PhoH family protein [Bacteroidales bacterium]
MAKTSASPKIFVLDTNVILHDYMCIYNFQDNDLTLPIVVLEELDRMKKGNDQINYNARGFVRELDKIAGDEMFSGGVSLGKKMGKLRIETGKPFSPELKRSFPEETPDHRILAITEHVKASHPDRQVILVTKDINLRMKAKSVGLPAQDYKSDKVQNMEELYKTAETAPCTAELVSALYGSHEGVPAKDFKLKGLPGGNAYYIFDSGQSTALGYYSSACDRIERVDRHRCFGIEPRNAEQTFCMDALLRPEIPLIAITGKAGTGKTLLALAAALAQNRQYARIYLARPIVPLANRDLGFLPGSARDKIEPYMQPLFDNLGVIRQRLKQNGEECRKIEEMLKSEALILSALAYIRGRSLSETFFIVDEAQNLTPHEVKTIITRAGEGTKIVMTGDIEQIDSPYLDAQSNGLSYLADKMKNQPVFAHINLLKGERSKLAELASDLL